MPYCPPGIASRVCVLNTYFVDTRYKLREPFEGVYIHIEPLIYINDRINWNDPINYIIIAEWNIFADRRIFPDIFTFIGELIHNGMHNGTQINRSIHIQRYFIGSIGNNENMKFLLIQQKLIYVLDIVTCICSRLKYHDLLT